MKRRRGLFEACRLLLCPARKIIRGRRNLPASLANGTGAFTDFSHCLVQLVDHAIEIETQLLGLWREDGGDAVGQVAGSEFG